MNYNNLVNPSTEIFSNDTTSHTTRSKSQCSQYQEGCHQLLDELQSLASTVQVPKLDVIRECLAHDVRRRIYLARLDSQDEQRKRLIDKQALQA